MKDTALEAGHYCTLAADEQRDKDTSQLCEQLVLEVL